jgi:hypothetical protein
MGAADPAHLLLRKPQELLSFETDPPPGNPPRLVDEAQNGQGGDRLAAPALPHNPQNLSAESLETDAVDSLHDTFFRMEMDGQILDVK